MHYVLCTPKRRTVSLLHSICELVQIWFLFNKRENNWLLRPFSLNDNVQYGHCVFTIRYKQKTVISSYNCRCQMILIRFLLILFVLDALKFAFPNSTWELGDLFSLINVIALDTKVIMKCFSVTIFQIQSSLFFENVKSEKVLQS